jgi:MFS family permease
MTGPTLGLRANWRQFWLLVLINAFVGAMVGLERTVLPLLAERDFGLASRSAMLSFIVTFGIVKALTNFVAGRLGDRFGRKRVLVAGWLFALPVPLMVIWAPSWAWIVAANVLLGINQGLAWSTTVVMKIDLVGPARRGFAMGLNEFAGYLAVALSALVSGEIASRAGLRPEPFYLGIVFAVLGLALTLLFVRDTLGHVRHEVTLHAATPQGMRAPDFIRERVWSGAEVRERKERHTRIDLQAFGKIRGQAGDLHQIFRRWLDVDRRIGEEIDAVFDDHDIHTRCARRTLCCMVNLQGWTDHFGIIKGETGNERIRITHLDH